MRSAYQTLTEDISKLDENNEEKLYLKGCPKSENTKERMEEECKVISL